MTTLLALLTGLAFGAIIGGLTARAATARRSAGDSAAEEERFRRISEELANSSRKAVIDEAKRELSHERELTKVELAKERQAVEALVKPVADSLSKVGEKIDLLEKERSQDSGRIKEQLENIAKVNAEVGKETRALAGALRRPEGRGRWGELQLRRVVELAGMTEYCDDFTEQSSVDSQDGGRLRPDMIVHIAGGRSCVIDSKAPLRHLLDAYETDDPDQRDQMRRDHATALKGHIRDLSAKAYWEQFEEAPDLVLMFLPGEHFLQAALEIDPTLTEFGAEGKVIIATPSTLLTMLKAVHYGWRNEAVADNAKEIAAVGKVLYQRIGKVVSDMQKVGKQLGTAVGSFNDLVGSVDGRLIPGARQLAKLDPGVDELPDLDPLEATVRESRHLSSGGDEKARLEAVDAEVVEDDPPAAA